MGDIPRVSPAGYPTVLRYTEFRSVSEFDCVTSGQHCYIDEFFSDRKITIMVYPDLCDDIGWMSATYGPSADLNYIWHIVFSFNRCMISSANSRIAP